MSINRIREDLRDVEVRLSLVEEELYKQKDKLGKITDTFSELLEALISAENIINHYNLLIPRGNELGGRYNDEARGRIRQAIFKAKGEELCELCGNEDSVCNCFSCCGGTRRKDKGETK